jgi:hypothetical protein
VNPIKLILFILSKRDKTFLTGLQDEQDFLFEKIESSEKITLRSADMLRRHFAQMLIGLCRQTPSLRRAGQETYFQ